MTDPNPYAAPSHVDSTSPTAADASTPGGADAYNIVSDTIIGMNVRKSDNLFQLKVILVCMLLGAGGGAGLGYTFADSNDRATSALAGALGMGLLAVIVGLLGSGMYLMIYRGVRHLRGHHD